MYKAKAPFRLGLAGGGTDVSPYSDLHGGAVLNATVSLYAETTIALRDDNRIIISDGVNSQDLSASNRLDYIGDLDLAKAVYNVIQDRYPFEVCGFELTTISDVQTGSGLGTSSTIVVSILGAFLEWRGIELTDYEIAALAYHIERIELGMAGGKQDQYAAVFGGLNFIQFGTTVRVNPIQDERLDDLADHIVLYYTKSTRESHNIILRQIENVKKDSSTSVQAMHDLKSGAEQMKAAIEKSELTEVGSILNASWESKKRMASGITNPMIDEIYSKVIEAGALGGKISGAGGGGFMIFFVEPSKRSDLEKALTTFNVEIVDFRFTKEGMRSWSE